jgi:hypothetical protein
MRLCTVCRRVAKGLYYTHLQRPELHPTYAFCSVRCLRAGAAIAKRNLGMIDKTKLETQAIKAARQEFAEVLTELGLMPSFHERSADEIDRIIEACVDGFQQAMQRQVLNDDVPF